MDALEHAYRRSALPGLGISYERAVAEPVLRGTLELLERIHTQAARQAEHTAAGRYLERSMEP